RGGEAGDVQLDCDLVGGDAGALAVVAGRRDRVHPARAEGRSPPAAAVVRPRVGRAVRLDAGVGVIDPNGAPTLPNSAARRRCRSSWVSDTQWAAAGPTPARKLFQSSRKPEYGDETWSVDSTTSTIPADSNS